MIYKVYPSLNDYENFSRLKVESSDFANNFDYSNIVVNKPWGYEYLWFQNKAVAIWFLCIKKGQSTSLHCHAKKRTALIVLNGRVQCTTIDDKYELNILETVVLEPCVFHSSKALEEDTFIMEIETPPMKGDLVRMHDAYGRQHAGYENTKEYSKEFHLYSYQPFEEKKRLDWKFKSVEIKLCYEQPVINSTTQFVIPISTNIKTKNKKQIEVGETITTTNIDLITLDAENKNCQFLIFNKLS